MKRLVSTSWETAAKRRSYHDTAHPQEVLLKKGDFSLWGTNYVGFTKSSGDKTRHHHLKVILNYWSHVTFSSSNTRKATTSRAHYSSSEEQHLCFQRSLGWNRLNVMILFLINQKTERISVPKPGWKKSLPSLTWCKPVFALYRFQELHSPTQPLTGLVSFKHFYYKVSYLTLTTESL